MNKQRSRITQRAGRQVRAAGELAVGTRLRQLRQRSQLSMRQVAQRAGVAVSYLSGVEAGRVSPTIVMLRKLLVVLGSDLGTFFGTTSATSSGHVFRRETMKTVVEERRAYTFLLPRRADIPVEVLDEEYQPGERPEFETLEATLVGYVVSGEFAVEIGDEPRQALRAGDAFFIPKDTPVRGCCAGDRPARLVTICYPPRY